MIASWWKMERCTEAVRFINIRPIAGQRMSYMDKLRYKGSWDEVKGKLKED
jgi:hypothetical protein